MRFIETSVFTKARHVLLSDDEYRELQNLLLHDPTLGDVIRGGGGIRKMRFGIEGMAKVAAFASSIFGCPLMTKFTCC